MKKHPTRQDYRQIPYYVSLMCSTIRLGLYECLLGSINIRMSKIFACLLVIAICSTTAKAQDFLYDEYAPAFALKEEMVSVQEMADSRLLVLTNQHLYAFDSYRFNPIHAGLQIGETTRAVEFRDKQFFITQPNGVYQLLPVADTFKSVLKLRCDQPIQLYQDRRDQTWIINDKGEIIRVDKKGKQHYYTTSSPIHHAFFTEIDAFLWVISDQGLAFRYDTGTDTFVPQLVPVIRQKINVVVNIGSKSVWMATDNGLFEASLTPDKTLFAKPIHPIRGVTCLIYDDRDDYIYVGTKDQGLLRTLKNDPKRVVSPVYFANTVQNKEKIPFKSVYHLYKDNKKNLWICNDLGISQLRPKSFSMFYNDGPIDDWVLLRQTMKKNYYFAKWSISGVLFRISSINSNKKITPIIKAGHSAIVGIGVDRNDLWIGNSDGEIFWVSNDRLKGKIDLSKRGKSVFNLWADSKHRVWFAQAPNAYSLAGVSYTDSTLQVRHLGEKEGIKNRILCFIEDQTKSICFGGVGEDTYLYKTDENAKKITNISLPLSFDARNLEVHDIAVDAKNDLWLATSHGLLHYFTTEQRIERVDLGQTYLTKGECRSIAIDQFDQIWIGADISWVLCYHNGETTTFEADDGVPSKIVYYRSMFIDQMKQLWVITDAGLAYTRNYTSPVQSSNQPIIDSIKINKVYHHYRAQQHITLPNGSSLEMRFNSRAFPASSVFFQWRILGIDSDSAWSEVTTSNQFFARNLPHGDYTIEVRARQQGYQWSPVRVINLHVHQKWYLQKWMFLVYGLFLIVIIILIIRWNIQRLYQEKIHLQEKIDRKTKELIEKNNEISIQNLELRERNTRISQQAEKLEALNTHRNHLFSIISHDLRGPFGSIKGILSFLMDGVISDEAFKSFIPELLREMDQTSNLIDNLLFWTKNQMEGIVVIPQHISLLDLVVHQIDLFRSVARNKGVIIQHTIAPETTAFIDAQIIATILRNLLANAIKFCRAGDSVTIHAEIMDHHLRLLVADTGVGILPENQKKLFQSINYSTRGTASETGTGLGLLVCKEFIEKMNGTISVVSERGKGSTLSV